MKTSLKDAFEQQDTPFSFSAMFGGGQEEKDGYHSDDDEEEEDMHTGKDTETQSFIFGFLEWDPSAISNYRDLPD